MGTSNQDEAIPGTVLGDEQDQNSVQHLDKQGWEQDHVLQASDSQTKVEKEKNPNQDEGQIEEYYELSNDQVLKEIKNERYQPLVEPVTPNSPSYAPSTPIEPEGYVAPNPITDWDTKEEVHHHSQLIMDPEREAVKKRKRPFYGRTQENQVYQKRSNPGPGNLNNSEYTMLGAVFVPLQCFLHVLTLPSYSIDKEAKMIQMSSSLRGALQSPFRPKRTHQVSLRKREDIFCYIRNPLDELNLMEGSIHSHQGLAFFDCYVPAEPHSFGGIFVIRSLIGDGPLFDLEVEGLVFVDGCGSCLCVHNIAKKKFHHSTQRHVQLIQAYGLSILGGICSQTTGSRDTLDKCDCGGLHVQVNQKSTNHLNFINPNLVLLSANSKHIEVLISKLDSNERIEVFCKGYTYKQIQDLLDRYGISKESADDILKHNTVKLVDIAATSPFEAALVIIPLEQGDYSFLLTPALVAEIIMRWCIGNQQVMVIEPVLQRC